MGKTLLPEGKQSNASTTLVHSVVYLVSCFVSCALLLILMDKSSLIGLIYIIVYVGAIAILFIFVIMMMDLTGNSGNGVNTTKKVTQAPESTPLSYAPVIIITLTVLYLLSESTASDSVIYGHLITDFTTWEIPHYPFWDSLIQGSGRTVLHSIGYLLYTDLLSLLLLIALVLLMVMIAVIAMVTGDDS